MKKILTDLYEGIKGSLDTTDKGFSGRKMTAFAIVAAIMAAHAKWLALGDLSNLEMVLTIDYGFIAALFGMTTYSAIKSKSDKVDINPQKQA